VRIERISAHGFRGLKDVDITLDNLTLVLGANGSGKSSLAGAVQMALTGHCRWTTSDGKLAKPLVRYGHTQATCEVVLDTDDRTVVCGREIITGVRPYCSAPGRLDMLVAVEAEAYIRQLVPGIELADCLLSSEGFIDLPPKQQQATLFSLAGGEADAQWFASQLTEEEREAVRDELATRLVGAALAESVHASVYARRTTARRRLKELEAQLAVVVETAPAVNITEMETALASARAELADLQVRIGRVQERTRHREQTQERLARAEADEAAIRQALEQLPTTEPPTKAAVTKARKAVEAAQARLDEAERVLTTAYGELAAMKATLESRAPADSTCPLDGVLCPRGDELVALADKLARECAALTEMVAQREAERDEARQVAQEAQDALSKLLDAQQAAGQTAQRRQELAERLESLEQEIETLRGDLREEPEDIAVLTAQRDMVQTAIAEQEAAIRTAYAAQQARKHREETERMLAQARQEVALLDRLVEKFGPAGLPAQAMTTTVGQVIDAINDVLKTFTGFQLAIDPGADFSLAVVRGDETTPIRLLSESERLRVGAAIQVAFARLTGFPLVVVDAADRLDAANRPQLLAMLLRSGVQALVLATPGNGHTPRAPGLVVYQLDDGTATEV